MQCFQLMVCVSGKVSFRVLLFIIFSTTGCITISRSVCQQRLQEAKTLWLDYDTNTCVVEFFDFDRDTWEPITKTEVGRDDACYRAVAENLR